MNEYGIGGGVTPPGYYNDAQEKAVGMPSLKTRIDMAVKSAEEKLAATKRAREILDAHPDLEELLNIMQRSHF